MSSLKYVSGLRSAIDQSAFESLETRGGEESSRGMDDIERALSALDEVMNEVITLREKVSPVDSEAVDPMLPSEMGVRKLNEQGKNDSSDEVDGIAVVNHKPSQQSTSLSQLEFANKSPSQPNVDSNDWSQPILLASSEENTSSTGRDAMLGIESLIINRRSSPSSESVEEKDKVSADSITTPNRDRTNTDLP